MFLFILLEFHHPYNEVRGTVKIVSSSFDWKRFLQQKYESKKGKTHIWVVYVLLKNKNLWRVIYCLNCSLECNISTIIVAPFYTTASTFYSERFGRNSQNRKSWNWSVWRTKGNCAKLSVDKSFAIWVSSHKTIHSATRVVVCALKHVPNYTTIERLQRNSSRSSKREN